jgi:hypothetical protein
VNLIIQQLQRKLQCQEVLLRFYKLTQLLKNILVSLSQTPL